MNSDRRVMLYVIAIVVLFVITSMTSATSVAGDENDSFSIIDGKGHLVSFDNPAEHIVTVGKGTSATVVEVGCINKIVVTDKYSVQGDDDVFIQLKEYVSSGHATAGGSMYSSDINQLEVEVVDAADSGRFDREKDAIIISGGGEDATKKVYDYFTQNGFRKVLVWTSINDYNDIIDFCEDVSKIVTGSISECVKQMRYTISEIDKVMTEKCLDKVPAFTILWRNENWQVCNQGSLAASMIMDAGGNVITIDESRKDTFYPIDHPSQIIDEYGENVIVFADATISGDKMNDLRKEVGSNVKIVSMKALWNNYCPDSIDGVWAMACAMHPDYFHGDVPVVPVEGEGYAPYLISGIVAALIVVGVTVYLMRRE